MTKIRFILLFFLPLFFLACKEQPVDTDGDGIVDMIDGKEVDKCPTIKGDSINKGCPPFTKVKFYIDNSASMSGYFKKTQSTDFKEFLSNKLVLIKNALNNNLEIGLINSNKVDIQLSLDTFISNISNIDIARARSSELHKTFEKISTDLKDSEILFFVTDAIMSFDDIAIQKNREINRIQLDAELKSKITKTFSIVAKKGLETWCFQKMSNFTGTYYTYRNEPENLNNTIRPFYIWVIGKADLLKYREKELRNALEDQKTNYHLFSKIDSAFFNVFNDINDGISISGDEIILKEKLDTIYLGLDGIEYDSKFLRELKSLKVINNQEAMIEVISDQQRNELKKSITNDDQNEKFENNIIVKVYNYENDDNLNIEIPNGFQKWITRSNIEDDSIDHTKTFGLRALMEGIHTAYCSNNSIKIRFNKQYKE